MKKRNQLIVSAVIQNDEWEIINKMAQEENRSRSFIVERLIRQALENNKK